MGSLATGNRQGPGHFSPSCNCWSSTAHTSGITILSSWLSVTTCNHAGLSSSSRRKLCGGKTVTEEVQQQRMQTRKAWQHFIHVAGCGGASPTTSCCRRVSCVLVNARLPDFK